MSFDAAIFLEGASVESEVLEKHPTYSAHLIVVEGIQGAPSDERTNSLLAKAEAAGIQLLETTSIEEIPEVAAWRDAYLSFGVKQRVARSSFESLLRRCSAGLPRIDMLTDLYNAISVLFKVPIGGEDLDRYDGFARLVVARGDEKFEIYSDGELVNQSPDEGEVVWRDGVGVTCRRWNWRQCDRTHLGIETKRAFFIIDALGVGGQDRAKLAANELIAQVMMLWPTALINSRVINAESLSKFDN